VEFFHLSFIRILSGGKEKASFIIKGGCNLRFFFGSIRYSEDLGLDVRGLGRHALKDRVDAIMSSKALLDTLRAKGLELAAVSPEEDG
jgi:hypothetical protein